MSYTVEGGTEEYRQVVQIRLEDQEYDENYTLETWGDTTVNPFELEQWREKFPNEEYRLVSILDEIPRIDESVSQEITPEDEIEQLKEEVITLKARLSTYESDQELNF